MEKILEIGLRAKLPMCVGFAAVTTHQPVLSLLGHVGRFALSPSLRTGVPPSCAYPYVWLFASMRGCKVQTPITTWIGQSHSGTMGFAPPSQRVRMRHSLTDINTIDMPFERLMHIRRVLLE